MPVSAASAARPHLHSGNGGNWDITPEYHCGGKRIYDWESGGSAAYGNGQDSLAVCEATCLAHDDCNGFVLRDRDSLCSFWKGGILTLKPAAGHHCYAKRTPPTEAECIAADVCTANNLFFRQHQLDIVHVIAASAARSHLHSGNQGN